MDIRTVRPEEHAEYLLFCNAGMRPKGAPTRVEDDFPVIFSPDNCHGLWGIRDQRGWAAGLNVLTRTFTSTAGAVRVAGIGSVVTRADRRGEGLSSRLQTWVLGHLAAQGVPLAVLWTDQPEIYAGRGFKAAGWEYHLDVTGAELAGLRPGAAEIRTLEPADVPAIAGLYAQHALATRREAADAALLYGMPGTTGLVLIADGALRAYAFCGKGEDFCGYVAEWGGPAPLALAVIAEARRRGLASRVLVPAGTEHLVALALPRAATVAVVPSGYWNVLRPDLMPQAAGCAGGAQRDDPCFWLGQPGPGGQPLPGRLALAVWGLDSV